MGRDLKTQQEINLRRSKFIEQMDKSDRLNVEPVCDDCELPETVCACEDVRDYDEEQGF